MGEALAMFEMKLVLATILLNYELTLEKKQLEKAKRREVGLAPRSDLKMLLKGNNTIFKKYCYSDLVYC